MLSQLGVLRKEPIVVLGAVSTVDNNGFFVSGDFNKKPPTFSVKTGDRFCEEKGNNGGGGGITLGGVGEDTVRLGDFDRSLLSLIQLELLVLLSRLFKSFLFHISCVLSAIKDNKLKITTIVVQIKYS